MGLIYWGFKSSVCWLECRVCRSMEVKNNAHALSFVVLVGFIHGQAAEFI